MLKLLNKVLDQKISPNGFYILLAIKEDGDMRLNNIDGEFKVLLDTGFVTHEGLTEKGEKAVSAVLESFSKGKHIITKEDREYIEKYRELFPKGNLPSGHPARVPAKELEKKFMWFFSNYDYTWDVIINATKKYINQYEPEGYKYMKTSTYFIYKSNPDKTGVSTLASYCDMMLDVSEDDGPKEVYNNAI